jgi:hypothetical protein
LVRDFIFLISSRRRSMKVAKVSEVPRQSMSRATKFFHGAEHVSRQGLTDESKEVNSGENFFGD